MGTTERPNGERPYCVPTARPHARHSFPISRPPTAHSEVIVPFVTQSSSHRLPPVATIRPPPLWARPPRSSARTISSLFWMMTALRRGRRTHGTSVVPVPARRSSVSTRSNTPLVQSTDEESDDQAVSHTTPDNKTLTPALSTPASSLSVYLASALVLKRLLLLRGSRTSAVASCLLLLRGSHTSAVASCLLLLCGSYTSALVLMPLVLLCGLRTLRRLCCLRRASCSSGLTRRCPFQADAPSVRISCR
eukprot:6333500-Prymnesium_polylepis.1